MKKGFTVLLFFISCGFLFGQAPFPLSSEIKQFTESTTCVVLEDDVFSTYNAYIKQAMKEYWKITPYEFIKTDDFKSKRNDPSFSFIVLTETNFEKDKSNAQFYFLNLLQGKNTGAIAEMPEICAIPLAFVGKEDDDIDYGYKLGAILLFIQNHARMISQDPSIVGRKYLKYYNKNTPQVINKVILVRQEDLAPDINTIEKIKAIYTNDIKIVPEDSIIKAIQEKRPGTVILHKVGPGADKKSGYCFKMLIGTDDSDMYYYNQHIISNTNPDGLLPADLKRMARF